MYGWKRFVWPYPEWWTIAVSGAAWVAILAQPVIASTHVAHDHSHHAMTQELPALGSAAFSWVLMVVAMMFPMVLEPIRNIAARSLWRRRQRAIFEFLAGYVALWTLFGIVATAAFAAFQAQFAIEPAYAAVLGLGLAVVWQLMPAKRRALIRCHRTSPIAPTGWRADRDCLRSGWNVGVSCMLSCWALMLACVLSGHSIPVMMCAMVIGWTERHRRRPNQRVLCSGLVLLAVVQLVMVYV